MRRLFDAGFVAASAEILAVTAATVAVTIAFRFGLVIPASGVAESELQSAARNLPWSPTGPSRAFVRAPHWWRQSSHASEGRHRPARSRSGRTLPVGPASDRGTDRPAWWQFSSHEPDWFERRTCADRRRPPDIHRNSDWSF